MYKIVLARATGDGGLQDPGMGTYVSSVEDSLVPLTPWVENMANHGHIELKKVYEDSDWSAFQEKAFNEFNGDTTAALEAYLKDLPSEQKDVEKVTVVADPAELREEEDERKGVRRGRRAASREAETTSE